MKRILCLALLLLALPDDRLRAQEERPDPLKILAPFIDESTIAVGVVDVKNIDFGAIFTRLEPAKISKEEIAKLTQHAEGTRAAFVRAGGRFLFGAFDMEGLGQGPLIVAPVEKDGDASALAEVLAKMSGPNMTTKVQGRTVLMGHANVLARAAEMKAKAVPELAKGLAELGPLPNRVAAVLPVPFRRAQEELVPNLPKALGGGSIKTVTEGFQWAAVGADFSAELQIKAIVKAKNAQAAAELDRLIASAFAMNVEKIANQPHDLGKFFGLLRPKVQDDQLVLTLNAQGIETVLLPAIARVRETASRATSQNNLRQIGLAFHGYHDAHRTFPAQASFDKQKKPLLSWRVHLLPYLEQERLFKEFKLDEPWDSAHNKPLIAKMPKVYHSPNQKVGAPEGKTVYLVPAGKDLMFNGPKKTGMGKIFDGSSNTILAVEVVDSQAVYWTQPEDLKVDPKNPTQGLAREGQVFSVLFADGSVRSIAPAIAEQSLWWMFHPSDGNVIPELK